MHPPVAVEPVPEATGFEPYIPAHVQLRELTPLPLVVGTLLGIVFGASSLYLVLKVGMTVCASIPVAVISITLFRLFSKLGGRDATILENNIVQTAGSAGESIAFGVGVTMPAILILGFDLEMVRVAMVAVLGGLLGILMMIPLRRAFIVQQHGVLKYPEGTACAEVLKAGASAESRAAASASARREQALLGGAATSAATIFTGFGIGLAYKAANIAFKGWKDIAEKMFCRALRRRVGGRRGHPGTAGGRLHHRAGDCLDDVRRRRARVSRLHSGHQVLRIERGRALAPGTIPIAEMSPSEIRARTCCTSAPARWRPAASSACCGRCR